MNFKTISNRMNSGKYKRGSLMFAFLLAIFVFSSCNYNRKSTGWEYFDDMAHSTAYESYTANKIFADGKTMQPPVEGTIPRGMVPYAFVKSDEGRALAATSLINTLESTPANLKEGKRKYDIFCMSCHGDNGDGQGNLYVSKKYPYPPASLLSEKMLANPEADIYHVITVGHGIMAEHGSMIQPEDRWRIAMYIKQELQN
jgi:mono/diheme cytochrome c family protein